MEDFNDIPNQGGGGSGTNPAVALFLSLYLLLLAFFILLNAISSFEEVKSRQVMDSLTSTFTSLLPPRVTDSFTGQVGDVVTARQFMAETGDLFESAIPAARVQVIQPGEQMRISVLSDTLFFSGTANLRPAHTDVLDRIAAALANSPETFRYVMDFRIGARTIGDDLPIGETLEVARAGTIAREMLARGAPPDLIRVGLVPGDPAQVVIDFDVVPVLVEEPEVPPPAAAGS